MLKLEKELEKVIGAYYEEAPKEIEYPYAVFSLKRISVEDHRQSYILEINVWDRNRYYSRAEEMMDSLEKKLDKSIDLNDILMAYFYGGARQNIPDKDKEIKHIREQFEMYVYERRA